MELFLERIYCLVVWFAHTCIIDDPNHLQALIMDLIVKKNR